MRIKAWSSKAPENDKAEFAPGELTAWISWAQRRGPRPFEKLAATLFNAS